MSLDLGLVLLALIWIYLGWACQMAINKESKIRFGESYFKEHPAMAVIGTFLGPLGWISFNHMMKEH